MVRAWTVVEAEIWYGDVFLKNDVVGTNESNVGSLSSFLAEVPIQIEPLVRP